MHLIILIIKNDNGRENPNYTSPPGILLFNIQGGHGAGVKV